MVNKAVLIDHYFSESFCTVIGTTLVSEASDILNSLHLKFLAAFDWPQLNQKPVSSFSGEPWTFAGDKRNGD